MLWDAKHLMMIKQRSSADALVEEISVVEKHWKMLLNGKILRKESNHWRMQQQIKAISRQFFTKLIDGITFDDELECIFTYMRIMIVEKKSGMGMSINMMYDGRFWTERSCQEGIPQNEISSVVERLIASYVSLQKLMLRLADSIDLIRREYVGKIIKLVDNDMSKEFYEMVDVVECILHEFKSKAQHSYVNGQNLKFLFEFNGKVIVRSVSYHDHFRSNTEVYERTQDGSIVKKYAFQRVPMYKTSVRTKAKEFVAEGFLNIYTDRQSMSHLDSYFEIDSKPNEFVLCFLRRTPSEIRPLTEDYFKLNHTEICDSALAIKSSKLDLRIDYNLYVNKIKAKPLLPKTVLEIEFEKRYPAKFAAKNALYAEELRKELSKRRQQREDSNEENQTIS